MTVGFIPLTVADADALTDFLCGNTFPFHAGSYADVASVRSRASSGRFWSSDSQAYWINADDTRLGLVVVEDLRDETPVFDLRLADVHRGKGHAVHVLCALCDHVFASMPNIQRFEGQTREDNVAMRRTFLRSGFVKEAHYRRAWPVDDGAPLAAVAYAILRDDWESGNTTKLVWDDFAL